MSIRSYRIVWMIAVVVLSVTAAGTAQSAKIDLTGAWEFTVQSEAGTSMPAVTFKQEGEKLTGHYSSMLVGEADLTGTVKGQAVEFVVRADLGGMAIELAFKATAESKDSMKGTLDVMGLGGGTFTAKRK